MPISDIAHEDGFSNLTSVILNIVNLSISECVFPSCEKLAIVKPTLKGNLDSQNLSSYRPVSNLSFLSKFFENVILDQLMKYLGKK